MFGTIITETYGLNDRRAVRAAILDLCGPEPGWGWASNGIYAYFDPVRTPGARIDGSNIFYVGLATDLAQRFAQHNGLSGPASGSNKWGKIEPWLRGHAEIGLSLWVQSPLAQSDNASYRRFMGPAFADAIEQVYSEQQSQSVMTSVAHVEGLLIEAARLTYGTRPKWNRVGGRRRGAVRAQAAGDDLLRLMSNDPRSLFVARRSLRELSANPTWAIYETALHAARSHALMANAFSVKSSVGNGEIMDAINLLNRSMKSPSAPGGGYQTDYDRMLSDGYV